MQGLEVAGPLRDIETFPPNAEKKKNHHYQYARMTSKWTVSYIHTYIGTCTVPAARRKRARLV